MVWLSAGTVDQKHVLRVMVREIPISDDDSLGHLEWSMMIWEDMG